MPPHHPSHPQLTILISLDFDSAGGEPQCQVTDSQVPRRDFVVTSSSRPLLLWVVAMVSIHSKWRYLFMFLGIQLVVMALLSREGYQKRVSYFIRIFRKPDSALSGRNHTAPSINGGDVYANLSHLSKAQSHGDELPYCPKTSPLISECSNQLLSPWTAPQ